MPNPCKLAAWWSEDPVAKFSDVIAFVAINDQLIQLAVLLIFHHFFDA